ERTLIIDEDNIHSIFVTKNSLDLSGMAACIEIIHSIGHCDYLVGLNIYFFKSRFDGIFMVRMKGQALAKSIAGQYQHPEKNNDFRKNFTYGLSVHLPRLLISCISFKLELKLMSNRLNSTFHLSPREVMTS